MVRQPDGAAAMPEEGALLAGGPAGAVADPYDRRPGFERRLAVRWLSRAKRTVQHALWGAIALAAVPVRLRRALAAPLQSARPRAAPHRGAARTPPRAGDPRIRRILVIRTDLIGDLVLSLPAVRALRRAYPAATLDLLTLPSSAGVLAGERDIDRILIYDFNVWRRPGGLVAPRNWLAARNLARQLRGRHYDLCVSVAGDWASVLAWVSGARRRVGYAGEAYPGLMTDLVPGGRYRTRRHEVEYVRGLARAAGGLVDGAAPALHVTPEGAAGAERLLRRHGLDGGGGPLVALHAGARNGSAKRWPAASWAALADRLSADLGARVMLVGAPGDRALATAIRAGARLPLVDLTGETALPALVALLARCALVVSGDSGPLHIACAVGTPVVGLYGPTDPAISGPLAPDAIVLRQRIWCGPCYDARATAECRFHNPVCMKALTPEIVFAAVRRQLARRATSPPPGARNGYDGHAAPPTEPGAPHPEVHRASVHPPTSAPQ